MKNYITRRSLNLWNVAVVGGGTSEAEPFDFGSDVTASMVVRSALDEREPNETDIKTLMSRRDAAIDFADVSDIARLSENEIRRRRRDELPGHGLLVLYPIDRNSMPAPNTDGRTKLDAVADVIGVGLVFPRPPIGKSDEAVFYAADLSRMPAGPGDVENEDDSALDLD